MIKNMVEFILSTVISLLLYGSVIAVIVAMFFFFATL
jgi:hypothetical protein